MSSPQPTMPILPDSALENITRKMDGFNGADIESVVNEAVEKCFLESLEKENVTFDGNVNSVFIGMVSYRLAKEGFDHPFSNP